MTEKKATGKTTTGAPKAQNQKNTVEVQVDELTKKINFFRVKNDLLKKKRRFEGTQKELYAALEKVDRSNDFDFENKGEVKFKIMGDYNSETCSISNPFVVAEIIEAVLFKINEKLVSIDAEILA